MTNSDNKMRTEIRSSGGAARRLMRRARTASLATLLPDGTPYASLVNSATDFAGRPVVLISRLAWHTRNLEVDGRASLLFRTEVSGGDPLADARVTAIGRLVPCPDPACAERFLACHPQAAGYAGFGDFSFWRMDVERCHAIAGFGRIETLEAGEVILAPERASAIEQIAAEAVEHMNADHAETVGLYATRLLGQPPAEWRATTVDSDGMELSDGRRSFRLAFAEPVGTAGELRAALKALADQARRA